MFWENSIAVQCFYQVGVGALCRNFGLYVVYLRGLPVVLGFNDFHDGDFPLFITFQCLLFVFTCFLKGTSGEVHLFYGLCKRSAGGLYFEVYVIRHFIEIVVCHAYFPGGRAFFVAPFAPFENRNGQRGVYGIVRVEVSFEVIAG